jgi:hypothetical protein
MAAGEKTADDRVRELIAGALLNADEAAVRGLIAELVKQRLEEYDCRKIVEAAVVPVLNEMVKEITGSPDIQASLRAGAERAVKDMANRVSVKIDDRRW